MSQPALPTEPIAPSPGDGDALTERLEPTGATRGPETEVLPGPPYPPRRPEGPTGDSRRTDEARWRRILIASIVTVVALIAAVVAVILWRGGDGDETPSRWTTTSTTVAPSSTTTPSTVTTTASPTTAPTTATSTTITVPVPPPVDASTAVFPFASSSVRYDDPVAAARGFAVDFIGFIDPVVGEFMQGDTHSGEVEIRPLADGPATTVFVRQFGPDDTWWVLGSAATNIEVDEPDAGDHVTSPITVRGRAVAFEGTVSIEVRADGRARPIGAGTVTAGGDRMRPFEGEIAIPSPRQRYGAMVFTSNRGYDGRVWEAVVLRVRFR